MERACLFYFKDLNCLHVVNTTIVLKNFKINNNRGRYKVINRPIL